MVSSEYLKKVFRMSKRMESLSLGGFRSRFNNSEMRMIEEILLAGEAGERVISTQLARSLEVTRSAVSQMVNKLANEGIVQRVPDKVDRKIAYIELTDEALEIYRKERKAYCATLDKVIDRMGKENFEKMSELIEQFCDEVSEVTNERRR